MEYGHNHIDEIVKRERPYALYMRGSTAISSTQGQRTMLVYTRLLITKLLAREPDLCIVCHMRDESGARSYPALPRLQFYVSPFVQAEPPALSSPYDAHDGVSRATLHLFPALDDAVPVSVVRERILASHGTDLLRCCVFVSSEQAPQQPPQVEDTDGTAGATGDT